MFLLNFTTTFLSSKEKIVGNDQKLNKRLRTILEKLVIDPKHPSLKTHKVDTKNHGEKWSSWVTGDLRIIWDYDSENRLIILLLDIGQHTGSHKVYK